MGLTIFFSFVFWSIFFGVIIVIKNIRNNSTMPLPISRGGTSLTTHSMWPPPAPTPNILCVSKQELAEDKTPLLRIFQLKHVVKVSLEPGWYQIEIIINKHLTGDRDINACQEELIDAGFGDIARL